MNGAHEVAVLCAGEPSVQDRRAQRIAAFVGATANFAPLSDNVTADAAIATVDTIEQIAAALPGGLASLRDRLASVSKQIFVFGFDRSERHTSVLRALTSDELTGIATIGSGSQPFQMTGQRREWSGQLSGLTLGAADPARDRGFEVAAQAAGAETLIGVDGTAFLVRHNGSELDLWLAATTEVANLDEQVGRGTATLAWFSGIAPLVMFLRAALGNRVWQNDTPRACMIIDDPLLKSRYGFLEFAPLADSIRRNQFSTCIAFIPWNHRRSDNQIAALFAASGGSLGLCVHGCDHTRGEFASTDAALLLRKSMVAAERMRDHERRSGLGFADVMVFPQGLFSDAALTALGDAGYLAAINTDVAPINANAPLTLGELLDVAVTKFADFPLFGRRYPHDLMQLAFDLFVGKPAIAVEHHGYFRDGLGPLEAFVSDVKRLDPRIVWSDVETVCSTACVTRTVADGQVAVRFFTNRFRLTNTRTSHTRFVLECPRSVDPARVTVDGIDVRSERDRNLVTFTVALAPGASVDVRLEPKQPQPAPAAVPEPAVEAAKIWLRRRLSEFRDNHVDTSPMLTALADRARGRKGTRPVQAVTPGTGTSRGSSVSSSRPPVVGSL